MRKIFAEQSALRVTLRTFADLEDAASVAIKYRKPNGALGEFSAAVGDSAKGAIFHECLEGELDMAGWWAFWAFIVFADGRAAAGEVAKVYVWREGNG